MPRPFLTAQWKNLCLINYQVPRSLLERHLPKGLELDAPAGTPPGMGVASLVAFDFLDTRVLGVRWPGHVNFPEINLRFYARLFGAEGDHRGVGGVCFVRELVPRRFIAMVARRLYNEPYSAARMASRAVEEGERLIVEHRVEVRGARPSTIRLTASRDAVVPNPESLDHWFKEHQWGFGRSRAGQAIVYEVRHPCWAAHRVEQFDLDFDWAGIYGAEWAWLQDRSPLSVVLAQGSLIEVHPKRILKGTCALAASETPRA